MEQGLVHIYCGDGKGKTTCAFGLALRCAGTGARVRIAQFLKSGDSGEVTAMQQFDNVELLRAKQGTKFTFQMNAAEKAQAARDTYNCCGRRLRTPNICVCWYWMKSWRRARQVWWIQTSWCR